MLESLCEKPKKKTFWIHLLNIAGKPLNTFSFLELNIKYFKSIGSKLTMYFRHITEKHNC